jgi:hypothetical protein
MGVYPARFLFLVGFLVIDLGLGAAASVGLVAVEAEAAMVPRCFDGRHDDRCGLGNRKCRFQEGGKRDMLSGRYSVFSFLFPFSFFLFPRKDAFLITARLTEEIWEAKRRKGEMRAQVQGA